MKYKQLSSISDEFFPRIKKIFISPFDQRREVIIVTTDDMVYGFGKTVFAILGMRTAVKISKPTLIEELCHKDIKKVMFGYEYMVALTESNELYTGGLCEYGRCGNGRNDRAYCKPRKIFVEYYGDFHSVVDFSCGQYYTVLLTDKQHVFTFGSFKSDGSYPLLTPTRIDFFNIERIKSISCGLWHALALSQTGNVYCWGSNYMGQLGLNHTNDEYYPKLVRMPNRVPVKQIACGRDFSLLLTYDGTIYSFGSNKQGQLGLNNIKEVQNKILPTLIETKSKFTEIFAFGLQSFAKNESNIIEIWGQNNVWENIPFPQQTKAGSFQEAIIHYSQYPFIIEPIILNNVSKVMPSDRVMETMKRFFNNKENFDFKIKIRFNDKFDETDKECPKSKLNNGHRLHFLSDDPNDGYDIIYCHKWVIEENCDFLKKMFANLKSNTESKELEIKGYSYETFFHFIQYLYTDSIETKDIKLLNELLLLSDKFSEEELKTRCVSEIKPLLDVENVCQFYSSAITNRSSELEEYCFKFMFTYIKSIIDTEGYDKLDAKIAKSFHKKLIKEQN